MPWVNLISCGCNMIIRWNRIAFKAIPTWPLVWVLTFVALGSGDFGHQHRRVFHYHWRCHLRCGAQKEWRALRLAASEVAVATAVAKYVTCNLKAEVIDSCRVRIWDFDESKKCGTSKSSQIPTSLRQPGQTNLLHRDHALVVRWLGRGLGFLGFPMVGFFKPKGRPQLHQEHSRWQHVVKFWNGHDMTFEWLKNAWQYIITSDTLRFTTTDVWLTLTTW